jgi:hypothetical protein
MTVEINAKFAYESYVSADAMLSARTQEPTP